VVGSKEGGRVGGVEGEVEGYKSFPLFGKEVVINWSSKNGRIE